MNRRFEAPGEIIRRRGWLLVVAFVFVAAATAMKSAGVPSWAPLVEHGLAMALLVAFAVNQWRDRRRGTVRANADGVWLDGARVVSRRGIASAYLLSFEAPVVRVQCRHALPFDVRVEDEDAARELLDALGFGIGQSIAIFHVFHGGRRQRQRTLLGAVVLSGALGACAGALLHHVGALYGLLVMSTILGVATVAARARLVARVEVGSDGVLVRRLGQQRFVPYSAIAGASVDGQDALVAMRSGALLRLSLGASLEALESRDALVRRIEEARDAFARGHAVESVAALVAPGGRPVDRWLHELRHLTDVRAYREATLDRDRLWDLLDDPSAPAATRAGAAVALASGDDPEARARLRVAADACAEPQLRITLACVAEGAEEPELATMLETLVRTEG